MLSTRRRPFHTVKSPVSIFHDSSDFTSDTLDPLFVSSFLSSFLFFFLPLTTVFPLFLSFPLYENTLVRIVSASSFVVRVQSLNSLTLSIVVSLIISRGTA